MVAKSKLANKQGFKKVAKKASKVNANTKKLKRRPKTKEKPTQSPRIIEDEAESDHGEDMLDMVEEEDLQFLKIAINSRQYSLFKKVHFKEGKGKQRKVPKDDETLENNYEDKNDEKLKVKVRPLLPIKTKQGIVTRQIEQKDVEEEEDEMENTVKPGDNNGDGMSDQEEDDDAEGEYILEETEIDLSQPITPAQLLLQRAEILNKKKLHIGTLSSGLLENPEEKLPNLRTLLRLLDDDAPEVHVTIRKLVIIALLEVFKDLLPSYQIKPQDIDGVRVKKDTLKLHKYEVSLLDYYKRYLQKLEKFAEALYKKKGDSRVRSQGEKSIGEVAVQAMCDLLIAHPYFNFAPNLVQAVVPFLNNVNRNVRTLVASSLTAVFKADKKEEITLRIVRVINHYLKKHSHNVNPEMLEILLHLRIKDVNLDHDKEIEIKGNKLKAHKANILSKLSKKEKKRRKRLEALEHELMETKAEESKQVKMKNLTEITKFLFGIYFRILKGSSNTKVLGVCLEGLSKFAHCINLEYYVDIVNVLDKLLAEEWLGCKEKLHCIQTVFAILGGQGEALNLDPTRFYIKLYANMLDAHAGRTDKDFGVLLRTVMVGVLQRRKKITNRRIVGFAKRLATLSVQTLHNGALGALAAVKNIMQLCKAVDILLDIENECGDGKYDAELDDPEYCNAATTALYELALLARHYHPIVRKYAANIAKGVPASGEGSLPPHTPEELFNMFDMSQMAFNPPVTLPKKVQLSNKIKEHNFVDGRFRLMCYNCISEVSEGTFFYDV